MTSLRTIWPLLLLLFAGGCATLETGQQAPGEAATIQGPQGSLHVIRPAEPAAQPESATVATPAIIESAPPEDAVTPAPFWDQVRAGFRLPDGDHARVRKRTDEYGRHADQVERIFERGQPYLGYILEEVQQRGFPTEIVLLPFVESAYDPFAYSFGNAAGLWQFISTTGKMYGLQQDWWYDGRRDVIESTRAALDYLDYLQKKFDGDWLLAVAAYNSGSGAVSKAIKKNRAAGKPTDFWHLKLPRETSAYVPKLLAITNIVLEPERYDVTLTPVEPTPGFTVVHTGGQLDIAVAAELAGMDTEALYLLNPGYNRWTTHPEGPHRLVVPHAHAEPLQGKLAELPESERIRVHRHQVESGETLSHIARHYGTSTQALVDSNRLEGTLIRSGQHLLVPAGGYDREKYARLNRRILAANGIRSKQTYRVRSGDNLWTIARRYNVTVQQVGEWNRLDTDAPIRPGQKLVIYRGGKTAGSASRIRPVTYTVRSGDSLYRIAQKFNVSIKDLLRWNDLEKDRHLQPGQNLKLYVDVTRQSGTRRG